MLLKVHNVKYFNIELYFNMQYINNIVNKIALNSF